ncbi:MULTISPECIES: DUF1206 domain-containing protein [Aequorivita]|uniref:DUF1206 domain-containing protein n=1 Tax=Aequorivita iocasae TaxID=2803865 RepID=A0ABX7DT01_9FLAO|nr:MULTISPECIES: DUF1206 domain-containing protein [Aequorivita]QQX75904.1 DUF1206 domain-containing protein [Aequorivita iocasae]UCA55366.1 DUF1206 domain-containing protein [Aequorivita sp. F7]
MSSKKEKFASFGIATKGIVYFITGALTAMAAFGYGGKKSGSGAVIDFIAKQTFGQVLLILLAIGLLGYVFWRWYQAFTNPKEMENNTKGTVKRIAYFISGVLYCVLAIKAISTVIGSNNGGKSFTTKVFESEYATAVALIIGLGLAGKALYELYNAYSGKFKKDVESAGIPQKAENLILPAGKVGHTSRGIVAGILGFLFLKTGFAGNANKLSKTDAFGFIENEFGNIVMGLIALGVVAYGVFMIIKAKYSSLSVK